MPSKERLRRIERRIAEVELAAHDAGMSHTREVEVLEMLISAELIAGAATCAACPGSSLADRGRIADGVVASLRELKEATGEAGPAFNARVARVFAEAQLLQTLTPAFAERAKPILADLLQMVKARWRAPQH